MPSVMQSAINKLRGILAKGTSRHLAAITGMIILEGPKNPKAMYKLSSPFKQAFYLLALAMSTPEPAKDTLSKSDNECIAPLLEKIAREQMATFEQTPASDSDIEKLRQNHIAASAFLQGFYQARLASAEQIKARAIAFFSPLDAEIRERIGLTVSEAIHVADWILERLEAGLEKLLDAVSREQTTRAEYLDILANEYKGDVEASRSDPRYERSRAMALELIQHLNSHLTFLSTDLVSAFSRGTGEAFIHEFVTRRGEVVGVNFFAAYNPVERAPLIWLSEGELACPSINTVYFAILERFTEVVLQSEEPIRDRYLRARKTYLEQAVEVVFRGFFEGAVILPGVYEYPGGGEHDLVVMWHHVLFVVECKSARSREPFRDPAKSFVRLQRDFASDHGIQGAFDQALSLKQLIRSSDKLVPLYDSKGAVVMNVDPTDVRESYCICVTAENFGRLATDLTLMLEKPGDADYPWAVDAFDLEAFFDGLRRRGWGPSEFVRFLRERLPRHGRLHTADELDIAGFFLKYRTLDHFKLGEKKVYWVEGYADIFDAVWQERHGGPRVEFEENAQPVLTDVTRDLAQARVGAPSSRNVRVGRNDPCPCGSTLKYKKCCGRLS